jgi:hypothetical protein
MRKMVGTPPENPAGSCGKEKSPVAFKAGASCVGALL